MSTPQLQVDLAQLIFETKDAELLRLMKQQLEQLRRSFSNTTTSVVITPEVLTSEQSRLEAKLSAVDAAARFTLLPKPTLAAIRKEQGLENVKTNIEAHFQELEAIGEDGDPPLEVLLAALRE